MNWVPIRGQILLILHILGLLKFSSLSIFTRKKAAAILNKACDQGFFKIILVPFHEKVKDSFHFKLIFSAHRKGAITQKK